MEFLNLTGLSHLWQQILSKLSGKVDKVSGKGLSTEDYTTTEKEKLAGLTNYTHPTTAGNKHIPTGGGEGQVLKWKASGEAQWAEDQDTTYSPVTDTVNGLMTSAQKIKLDGIDVGANNYIHPEKHPASIITQDANNRFVTDAEKTTWNGKYTKPSTGIPKTDLASVVQASLGKADTAVQPTAIADMATQTWVADTVIGAAPETLDTLNELAEALGDDPNFAATIAQQIGGKAAKVHTHAISDVTNLQTSLDNKSDITHTHTVGTASVSGFTKLYTTTGSYTDGTITQKAITEALATKAASTHGHIVASTTADGFMAKADKSKLDGLYTQEQLLSALDGKSNTNHVHAVVTQTVDGFMGKADKIKLDNIIAITNAEIDEICT